MKDFSQTGRSNLKYSSRHCIALYVTIYPSFNQYYTELWDTGLGFFLTMNIDIVVTEALQVYVLIEKA